MPAPLRILQVGTVDRNGGAATAADRLMRSYRAQGHATAMAVGRKLGSDPDVHRIPDDDSLVCRITGYTTARNQLEQLAGRHPGTGWGLLSRLLRDSFHPAAALRRLGGKDDFEFAGTYSLLGFMSPEPDVVHCHNLHGGYFDLRALSWLSARVPTILTLHDGWLLSGHCAHSFDCDRWTQGCGQCPDLTIYPATRRDRTAENWTQKREIYRASRLYVATPSQWLMDRVRRSMLADAIVEAKVIPYGIDLNTFKAGDRQAARRMLNLAPDSPVVLLVLGRDAYWDNRPLLASSLDVIADVMSPQEVTIIGAGLSHPALTTRRARVRWAGYQGDPATMAACYRAADVYLHCARAATFPNTILESLACGTPVVASAVGGTNEQITHEETGMLVPPENARALADAVVAILRDRALAARLAKNAATDAARRFDLNREAGTYLAWYRAMIERWNHGRHAHQETPALTT